MPLMQFVTRELPRTREVYVILKRLGCGCRATSVRPLDIRITCRAFARHLVIFGVQTGTPHGPSKTSQRPAWIVRVRSGDLVFHGAPRQRDVRGRPVREIPLRVDENRLA